MKKNAKILAVVALVIVTVVIGIPAYMYLVFGYDAYMITIEDKDTAYMFSDNTKEQYKLDNTMIWPAIDDCGEDGFRITVHVYSLSPESIIITGVKVVESETGKVLFEEKKAEVVHTKKNDYDDECGNYIVYGSFKNKGGYLRDGSNLNVTVSVNSCSDDSSNENKSKVEMKYRFKCVKTRFLDTP